VAVSILPHSASAAVIESWVCAWPAYSPDHHTVIQRFNVEGDELVNTKSAKRYKALRKHSLVAAMKIAIGVLIVLIKKKDGSFRLSHAILDDPNDGVPYGSCRHENVDVAPVIPADATGSGARWIPAFWGIQFVSGDGYIQCDASVVFISQQATL
jgi:hypothetical protein